MIELTLPWPPSVNTYWRRAGHHMHLSNRGRKYRQDVGVLVLAQRIKPMAGWLTVDIKLYPPDKRRRDVDNTLKSLIDSLQHGGVFEDDHQIAKLSVERLDKVEAGAAVVSIRTYIPPTPAG